MALVIDRSKVEIIVREVVREQLGRKLASVDRRGPASPLVVNTSARHMHVTPQALETLFGPGAKLTPLRPLYQDGHFASNQTVTVIGPKAKLLSNLRILGPTRDYNQIELATTDVISLGFENVPVRVSGDLKGAIDAWVMGPAGMLHLKEAVIRAAIHVHMGEADAKYYGIKDKGEMKLRVGGESGVVFERVRVRVDPKFKTEVHMDTDEANACAIQQAKVLELFK